jgi:hypothetical protein
MCAAITMLRGVFEANGWRFSDMIEFGLTPEDSYALCTNLVCEETISKRNDYLDNHFFIPSSKNIKCYYGETRKKYIQETNYCISKNEDLGSPNIQSMWCSGKSFDWKLPFNMVSKDFGEKKSSKNAFGSYAVYNYLSFNKENLENILKHVKEV